LKRHHLESFLGLERFKRARQEWLIEDLRPWFPHHVNLPFSRTPSLASLFLSRVSLEHFPPGTMGTAQRIAKLKKLKPAVRACVFKLRRGSKVGAAEATMVSKLALLASGLATPR